MSKLALYKSDPAVKIVNGVCPHDCPDACSWQVAVETESERAIDIWGHSDHTVTQGTLCGKVDRYLERTYHANRLTTPLRRVGSKGAGQFEPVSWETALGEIAERLHTVIAEYGPEAVLPYSYSGTLGLLQGEGMATRFFNRMGASRLARTICSETGMIGYLYTIGATVGMEMESYAESQLILIWGSNTLTSNLHLWPFIQDARKQGARVIVIDPARTRTARAADEWIAIRPGTDAALALAMMHVIIDERLHDRDYVERYTLGFDALAARVVSWTPERASNITGIPAERIRQLAQEYATTRPSSIRINYGMQRHAGGGMAVRTIACLPALIGAWREVGGGIQLSASGNFRHLDLNILQRPELCRGSIPRTINMNRLGDALSLDPERLARAHYSPRPVDKRLDPPDVGPPVKALLVYNANPAAVTPDQSAVVAGLAREDLFTVVMENFQTDTADYADYLLPATTQLEHWNILRSYGTLYLALNRPAIAPVEDALPNSEIFRRLAQTMGYGEACFKESDEEILHAFVESQHHPLYETITWEKLMDQGFARINVPSPYLPFAEGNFPTPSGKCEFYSERMAQDGYDPVPTYTPPHSASITFRGQPNGQSITRRTDGLNIDDRGSHQYQDEEIFKSDEHDEGTPRAMLHCISPPTHSHMNSTFANVSVFKGESNNR